MIIRCLQENKCWGYVLEISCPERHLIVVICMVYGLTIELRRRKRVGDFPSYLQRLVRYEFIPDNAANISTE